jgi:hypothetical protein
MNSCGGWKGCGWIWRVFPVDLAASVENIFSGALAGAPVFPVSLWQPLKNSIAPKGDVMKSMLLLLALSLLTLPAAADWGPDLGLSIAWMDYSGEVSLFVVPDGSGAAFTEAMAEWGYEVDATVNLQLFDWGGNPIEAYPAEDMWLEASDGGLIYCAGGTCADGPTDAEGIAQWVSPLHAGGHSQELCQVLVNGSALWSQAGLPLHFNSADINGDLRVDLTDVSLFAMDFFGMYAYRSDFYHDGQLNIADLAKLAQAMGASCP